MAALKKPSAAAWAIDQAVRADRSTARALLEAGEGLRDAQKRAVRGGDPGALREAASHERDVVERLASRAVEAFDKPPAASLVDRIRDTLFGVSSDPQLHDQFLAGRLVAEHVRVGFGDLPDLKLVDLPRRTKPSPAKKRDEAAERRRKEREERLAVLRRELADAEDEAADLERRARTVRRRADSVKEQIDALERALR